MNEAARLRAAGNFTGAEQKLQALLVKNPADADAAMLLMRLYAQDLRQPAKAKEVLLALEKQPRVAVAHIDFAHMTEAIASMVGPLEWLVNTDFKPQWSKEGKPLD